jgi:hypothetical protein
MQRLAATFLALNFVLVGALNGGIAQTSSGLGTLSLAEQRNQAVTAVAIAAGCKADFVLIDSLVAKRNAIVAALDAEKGQGYSSGIIEQAKKVMGTKEGCANLKAAVLDGVYRNVFIELLK